MLLHFKPQIVGAVDAEPKQLVLLLGKRKHFHPFKENLAHLASYLLARNEAPADTYLNHQRVPGHSLPPLPSERGKMELVLGPMTPVHN